MLSQSDYINAVNFLKVELAAIQAVSEKEAGGRGFFKSGKVKIKFEGHRFSYFTKRVYDTAYPTISYKSWTEKYWSEDPYPRFNMAFRLDPEAAMKATSWGMFQIMGEHYATCGYKTVGDFVSAMQTSELLQLLAFCAFIKTNGYDQYLRKFALDPLKYAGAFALKYNGSGYKKNNYDRDIAALYLKYKNLSQTNKAA